MARDVEDKTVLCFTLFLFEVGRDFGGLTVSESQGFKSGIIVRLPSAPADTRVTKQWSESAQTDKTDTSLVLVSANLQRRATSGNGTWNVTPMTMRWDLANPTAAAAQPDLIYCFLACRGSIPQAARTSANKIEEIVYILYPFLCPSWGYKHLSPNM